MQTNKPTSGGPTAAPSTELTEPEPSVDGEVLDMRYGPGGFFPLDSDDIDTLIASGRAWMPPPTTAPPADEHMPSAEPAPRKAA